MLSASIIDLARGIIEDILEPHRWINAEMVAYLVGAVNQFCKRTLCLSDSSTTAITQVVVAASTRELSLDPRILVVRSCRLHSTGIPLIGPVTEDWMDIQRPTWRSDSAGTPLYFFSELATGIVGIHPTSSVIDQLDLSVYRLPLVEVTEANMGTVSPGFNSMYHLGLVDGILGRAFLKRDADTFNPKAAADHMALFESFISDAVIDIQAHRMSGAINVPHYGAL